MANIDVNALLKQIIKTENVSDITTYDIHLDGDKILFKDGKDTYDDDILINAQSFYDYLKNYFSKKMFITESDNHPDTANNENGNDNIIIWNDTGFETRFQNYLTENEIDVTDVNYNRDTALAEFEIIDNQISSTENQEENNG